MAKLVGLDKLQKVFQIISQHGGIRATFLKMFRTDDVKDGKLVGIDKDGNKYYENPRFFYGRNRWVEYAPKYGFDYDGSQVPAEWYGWLHYKTDLLPTNDPSRPKYAWMAEHTENKSGTSGQWVPYTTTRPKVEAWNPKQKQSA